MALLPDTGGGDTGTAAVIEAERQPNKTYTMLYDDDKVQGNVTDNIESVRQAAYKIINTERYKHVIYSWNYGIELADLFGKPIPWVLSEVKRRIREALIQDDRINDVTNFDISYDRAGNVLAKFTIRSIYGDLDMEKGVTIA